MADYRDYDAEAALDERRLENAIERAKTAVSVYGRGKGRPPVILDADDVWRILLALPKKYHKILEAVP